MNTVQASIKMQKSAALADERRDQHGSDSCFKDQSFVGTGDASARRRQRVARACASVVSSVCCCAMRTASFSASSAS